MDRYRIDSHKLVYHIDRVNTWLNNKDIYPIYIEISPAGACNHRCVYCALDFMEYKPRFLQTDMLKKRLAEMGRRGVRSIMYAGEGEPLLHRDIAEIVSETKRAKIDVALTTNAVLLDKGLVSAILPYTSWIKVSINAVTPRTYSQIHRAPAGDSDRVFENMTNAARLKRKNKYKTALGMQIILLPENYKEVLPLAKKAKGIGMDYLVVKPYSQHPLSITKRYQHIKYAGYLGLAEELKKLNCKDFNVIFRINTMVKWDEQGHSYKHCLALPFWAYIDASGRVWACSIYLGKERFCLGDIYTSSIGRIWGFAKRRRLIDWAASRLNTSQCRINCRMDEINRYLWELKHKPAHVNFI